MTTSTARRRRAIEHLVVTDHARDRLARAAFDVLADGLDLGPIALRSPVDRAWVRIALAGPIQRAADRALEQLVDELIDTFALGAPDLIERILATAPAELGPDPWVVTWQRGGAPHGMADGDRPMAEAAAPDDREIPATPVAVLR